MPKRLSDTEKWKKPFIKRLPQEYKLLWFYLLDDCDVAGIWQVDFEIADLRVGISVNEQTALSLFKDKIVVFDGGNKWFIPDFIPFQYGALTEKNKMYNVVTSQLKKYNLMGHLSPINGGMVKDTVKVKDKDMVIGEVPEEKHDPVIIPLTIEPNPDAPPKQDVVEFFVRQGSTEAESIKFYNYYDAKGWKIGFSRIFNWGGLANNWITGIRKDAPQQQETPLKTPAQIKAERNKK